MSSGVGGGQPSIPLRPPDSVSPPTPPTGYDGENLVKILKDIEGSSVVQMDRWHLRVLPTCPTEAGDPVPYEIVNNYFSIGVVRGAGSCWGGGGAARPGVSPPHCAHLPPAGRLHRAPLPRHAGEIPREVQQQVSAGPGPHPATPPCVPISPPRRAPPPRMKNKLWYLEFATSETLFATCKKLKECLSIEVRLVPASRCPPPALCPHPAPLPSAAGPPWSCGVRWRGLPCSTSPACTEAPTCGVKPSARWGRRGGRPVPLSPRPSPTPKRSRPACRVRGVGGGGLETTPPSRLARF